MKRFSICSTICLLVFTLILLLVGCTKDETVVEKRNHILKEYCVECVTIYHYTDGSCERFKDKGFLTVGYGQKENDICLHFPTDRPEDGYFKVYYRTSLSTPLDKPNTQVYTKEIPRLTSKAKFGFWSGTVTLDYDFHFVRSEFQPYPEIESVERYCKGRHFKNDDRKCE